MNKSISVHNFSCSSEELAIISTKTIPYTELFLRSQYFDIFDRSCVIVQEFITALDYVRYSYYQLTELIRLNMSHWDGFAENLELSSSAVRIDHEALEYATYDITRALYQLTSFVTYYKKMSNDAQMDKMILAFGDDYFERLSDRYADERNWVDHINKRVDFELNKYRENPLLNMNPGKIQYRDSSGHRSMIPIVEDAWGICCISTRMMKKLSVNNNQSSDV